MLLNKLFFYSMETWKKMCYHNNKTADEIHIIVDDLLWCID